MFSWTNIQINVKKNEQMRATMRRKRELQNLPHAAPLREDLHQPVTGTAVLTDAEGHLIDDSLLHVLTPADSEDFNDPNHPCSPLLEPTPKSSPVLGRPSFPALAPGSSSVSAPQYTSPVSQTHSKPHATGVPTHRAASNRGHPSSGRAYSPGIGSRQMSEFRSVAESSLSSSRTWRAIPAQHTVHVSRPGSPQTPTPYSPMHSPVFARGSCAWVTPPPPPATATTPRSHTKNGREAPNVLHAHSAVASPVLHHPSGHHHSHSSAHANTPSSTTSATAHLTYPAVHHHHHHPSAPLSSAANLLHSHLIPRVQRHDYDGHSRGTSQRPGAAQAHFRTVHPHAHGAHSHGTHGHGAHAHGAHNHAHTATPHGSHRGIIHSQVHHRHPAMVATAIPLTQRMYVQGAAESDAVHAQHPPPQPATVVPVVKQGGGIILTEDILSRRTLSGQGTPRAADTSASVSALSHTGNGAGELPNNSLHLTEDVKRVLTEVARKELPAFKLRHPSKVYGSAAYVTKDDAPELQTEVYEDNHVHHHVVEHKRGTTKGSNKAASHLKGSHGLRPTSGRYMNTMWTNIVIDVRANEQVRARQRRERELQNLPHAAPLREDLDQPVTGTAVLTDAEGHLMDDSLLRLLTPVASEDFSLSTSNFSSSWSMSTSQHPGSFHSPMLSMTRPSSALPQRDGFLPRESALVPQRDTAGGLGFSSFHAIDDAVVPPRRHPTTVPASGGILAHYGQHSHPPATSSGRAPPPARVTFHQQLVGSSGETQAPPPVSQRPHKVSFRVQDTATVREHPRHRERPPSRSAAPMVATAIRMTQNMYIRGAAEHPEVQAQQTAERGTYSAVVRHGGHIIFSNGHPQRQSPPAPPSAPAPAPKGKMSEGTARSSTAPPTVPLTEDLKRTLGEVRRKELPAFKLRDSAKVYGTASYVTKDEAHPSHYEDNHTHDSAP